jgi:hypothetical protein
MAHFSSAYRPRKGAIITAIICAAMLSAPGAIAAPEIFGMMSFLTPLGEGGAPVVIDPVTGIVTDLIPSNNAYPGNTFDAVSSGNTLYFVSDAAPKTLNKIDVTTGATGSIALTMPSLPPHFFPQFHYGYDCRRHRSV